ncbi:hypothetical protein HMPREF9412_6318 [Paenibacillus sp. HGF5]|nr:hypothetical protein HMPREF9412_6318 [Paenibacillus sp. HGF5]
MRTEAKTSPFPMNILTAAAPYCIEKEGSQGEFEYISIFGGTKALTLQKDWKENI